MWIDLLVWTILLGFGVHILHWALTQGEDLPLSSPVFPPPPIPNPEAIHNQGGATKMVRAVGYCVFVQCEDFMKGTFLLNHRGNFCCARCRTEGFQEMEHGFSADPVLLPYKTVRVEYNFDPTEMRYKDVAIIIDESIHGEGNTYTLITPLVKTDKRALKIAENMLANLNRYSGVIVGSDEIPRQTDYLLDLDEPRAEFERKVHQLGALLAKSPLAVQV